MSANPSVEQQPAATTPPSAVPTADGVLASWGQLGNWLRSISPAGYLRFFLVIGVAAGFVWMAWQAREAILPFLVGGAIAYILLPLVNWLDRVLPRFLAVLLALSLFIGGFVFLLFMLIPPLARQMPAFLQLVPDREEIQQILNQLRGWIQTLPPPTQAAILDILQQVSLTLRTYLDENLGGAAEVVVRFLIGIFNSIGFILGFLVVPAWLLNVLHEQPKGMVSVNRLLPATLREDAWAVLRIIDRPLRAFVSGQFLLALVTGFAVYAALSALEMMGWSAIQYKIPLAVWAAAFAFIPEIGPYLGALPAVLGGFLRSPEAGLTIIGVYIVLYYLVNRLVGERVEGRLITLHPVLLLVILAALSQLGFLWIFLAVPVVSILQDLFRYTWGRLSTPSLPAGLLPGQPVPQATDTPPTQRVPLAYRRSRAAKRTCERM